VLDTVEHLCTRSCPFTHQRSAVRYRPRPPRLGELPGSDSASVGQAAPTVGPLSADQQPATKADLYAAVHALRTDMRELLDEVRKLIQEAERRVSDAERGNVDDDW
jgi:hypothetical protein